MEIFSEYNIDKSKFFVIIRKIKTEEVGKMFSSFGEKSMERLESTIGKTVKIDFVDRKLPVSILGEMKEVKRFRFVEVNNIGLLKPLDVRLASLTRKGSLKIPFVWPGFAIQKIEAEEILYDNFWIEDDYNQLDPKKVFELAEIIFGEQAAQEFVELKQVIKAGQESIFKIFYT